MRVDRVWRGSGRSWFRCAVAGASTSARPVWRSTFLIASLALLSTSCSVIQSDKALVADSTAAYIWLNHEYKKSCVEIESTAPPNCAETFLLLKQLREDTTVANESQKIGKLPESARKKLKALVKALEK